MTAASPFRSVQTTLSIHLLPAHLSDVKKGVDEKLNLMLLRYSDAADGVVVAYSDVEVGDSIGRIMYDSPYIHFQLIGTVTKVSADHIGLLVFGLFNASIAAVKIRSEFEHADGVWASSISSDSIIDIGSDVRFDVTELHVTNGIMSVEGSLLSRSTGLASVPEPSPQPRRTKESRKSGSLAAEEPPRVVDRRSSLPPVGASVPPTPESARKKRKHNSTE